MQIALDITKTIDENANSYFEKAKKARKKLQGVEKTLVEFKEKQEDVSQVSIEVKSAIKKIDHSKKKWFEKFRWFITSEGYLVIGGRDATTNEIIIKKHTANNDIVFHTDMAGSPFVIIKVDEDSGLEKKELTQQSYREAAQFTLAHSKAWKAGLSTAAVFWVTPEQVTKEANVGEFLAKGSFMIRGKTTYVDVAIDYSIGIISLGDDQYIMGGPCSSLSAYTDEVIELVQGKEKSSDVAKQIRTFIRSTQELDVKSDDIIRVLPQGVQIKKRRKRKSEL